MAVVQGCSMTSKASGARNTNNTTVHQWVEEMARLCQPERIHWCDGSEAEKESLTAEAVAKGILIKLNQEKLPGCYYHRSDPSDVARVEQCTYICAETPEKAGPTNN
jgi:phosphoenolpyruvate carboxykinase (GTP)